MGNVTEPLALTVVKRQAGDTEPMLDTEFMMKKFQSAMPTETKDLRMWKKVQSAICFLPSFKYKVQ